jgi:DNA-binding CsgD family transcriptional regulator
MEDRPFGLTSKECDALRLLAGGHDVKSAAATLGISAHTLGERLREARRKTGSSSSRGAARLLAAAEGYSNSVPAKTGMAAGPDACEPKTVRSAADPPAAPSRQAWRIAAMVSVVVGVALGMGLLVQLSGAGPAAAPRVVSTLPAQGAVVAPGTIQLQVTFDRPMRPGSYSFVQTRAETYPRCDRQPPQQSADGRSFTLSCTIESGKVYEVWFNNPPFLNFVAPDGVAAIPFGLRFRTR